MNTLSPFPRGPWNLSWKYSVASFSSAAFLALTLPVRCFLVMAFAATSSSCSPLNSNRAGSILFTTATWKISS